MNYPTDYYDLDAIWEDACETAQEQLFDELGREPTDDEVINRAQFLIDKAEPDWDAFAKDERLFREDNCE